jgi:hypothetical protein
MIRSCNICLSAVRFFRPGRFLTERVMGFVEPSNRNNIFRMLEFRPSHCLPMQLHALCICCLQLYPSLLLTRNPHSKRKNTVLVYKISYQEDDMRCAERGNVGDMRSSSAAVRLLLVSLILHFLCLQYLLCAYRRSLFFINESY